MTSLSASVSALAFHADQAFRKLLSSFRGMSSRPRRHAGLAGASALLLLMGATVPSPLRAQAAVSVPTWTQQSSAATPPARFAGAMAYDASTGTVVLFGGSGSSGILNDTWTWNGATWTQQSPALSPPARYGATMDYDASTGTLVLFGGADGSSNLNDTWTWNGATWTHQSPATTPPARWTANMAYDASTGTVVLFGGEGNSGFLNDTWTWTGATWKGPSPAAAPPARYAATMAYDTSTGTVVLFGGHGNSGDLTDTWTWNGTTWTQRAPAATPSARLVANAAYDTSTGTVVLFGGGGSSGLLNDTWTWNGATWTQQSPAAAPPARDAASMTYDTSTGTVVLFGGVDSSGNLNDTWTYNSSSVNLGTANVCPSGTTPSPCSQSTTLTFRFTAAGTGVSPSVITQGASGLDFTDLGTGTCDTNGTGHTYSVGNTCSVNTTFAPTHPGLRMGAVKLLNSAGSAIARAYVYGVGQGPAVGFSPGIQTDVATNFSGPWGVAADAAGNVYASMNSSGNIQIFKIAPNGVQTSVGAVASSVLGLAVDGAGNVLYADWSSNSVVKVPPGCTTSACQTAVFASGLGGTDGVAVDGAGDVFITEYNNNRVVEVTPSGVQTTVPAVGLNGPQALAVDGAGNVYIADNGHNRVVKVSTSGVQTVVPASGLSGPAGVAVDAAGDVFISDSGNNQVVEVTPGGVQTTLAVTGGLSNPVGVAVDGAGNVYIVDQGHSRIEKLQFSQPPSMSFAAAQVGSQSSDSPQTVTVSNDGNAPLTFPIPSSGNNPSIATGFTLDGATTCPQLNASSSSSGTLASGERCTYAVDFIPTTAGTDSGALVLADTHLNAASAMQSISLTGTGSQPQTQSIIFSPIASPVSFGVGPITLSATGGGSGNPVTFFVLSGPATVSGNTLTITGAGTVIVAANQTGNAEYQAAPQVTHTVQVNQAVKTITFPQPVTPVIAGSSATLTATVSNGDPVLYPVLVGLANISGSTVVYIHAGTVKIGADSGPTANYSGAAPVSRTVVVNPAPTAYSAPTTAVGTTSATLTAYVTFASAGTLSAIKVLTRGAPNLDFNFAAGGTCMVGTAYFAGEACSVNYTFDPLSAGSRFGAVVLTAGNASVLGTSYLSGTGTGPLAVFTTTTQAWDIPSLSTPRGLSADGYGNLYVLETTNGKFDKIAAGTHTVQTLTTVAIPGSGGTAVDGAGNLFVSVNSGRTIYEYVGGQLPGVAIVTTNCGGDDNIEADGAGNLYYSCFTFEFGAIYKVNAVTHAQTQLLPGSLAHRFVAMTVDAAGNVYAADYNSNTLYKLPAGSTGVGSLVTLVSGGALSNPHGIALDPAGNIYVSNYTGPDNVLRYAAGTFALTTLPAAGSRGVVLDGSGNLYTIPSDTDVAEYSRTSAPGAITFANTRVGTTSNSVQSVELENDGNAPLTITSYQATGMFSLGGPLNTCATGTLASGAACQIGAIFSPTALGPQTGSAEVTDDTQNMPGSVQTAPLSGTAIQGPQAINFTAPASPVTFGVSPVALTATGGGSTSPVLFSTISGPGSVSGNVLTVTGVGTIVVAANQAGDANYLAAPQVTQSTVVQQASQSINFTAPSSPVTYGVAPITLAASGDGGSGNPVVFSLVSGPGVVSGTTLTVTGTGTIVVAANQAGDTNYLAAPQVTQSIVVNPATLTAAIIGNPTKPYDSTTAATLTSANYQLSGLVGTDSFAVNQTAGTYASANAGSQNVTANLNAANFTPFSGLLSNYTLPATATGPGAIAQVHASVTPNPAGKIYGAADPALTGTLTGFLPADNVKASYTRAAGETVAGGPYTISATLKPAFVLSNYSITYYTGSFTIAQAQASVTPNAAGKTYGTADPTLTGTLSGFLPSDGVTAIYSRTPGQTVGAYAISAALNPASVLSNYTIQSNPSAFTITPATLIVAANNTSQVYGTAPVLTATITGYVNGDNSSAFSGAPALGTTATSTSLPGTYPITVGLGTLAAANYTFNLVGGTDTVAFTASVPGKDGLCNGTYYGTYDGNLKVTAGEVCIFIGGGVTGHLQQSGGTVELIGATVGSNFQVNGGGFFTVTNGSLIEGNLQIQQIPAGSGTNLVCGSTVQGDLQFQNNGTAVRIGGGGGGPSFGNGRSHGGDCPGNEVDGNLQVQNNTAPATIVGNVVGKNLTVQGNTAATTIDNNIVTGNLQDESNTASTQVFNDAVGGNLLCQGDLSITGGNNTAKSKQNQCATF